MKIDYNKRAFCIGDINYRAPYNGLGHGCIELEFSGSFIDENFPAYFCLTYNTDNHHNYEIIWDYETGTKDLLNEKNIIGAMIRPGHDGNERFMARKEDGYFLITKNGWDTIEMREEVTKIVNENIDEIISAVELITADALIGG